MSEAYNAGITIKDQWRDGSSHHHLPADKAAKFIAATRAALDGIGRTPMGASLLAAIANSGHNVNIYRTQDLNDPSQGNYQGGGDDARSFVVPLDRSHPPTGAAPGGTELARVLEYACADVSKRGRLKRTLGIGKAVHRFIRRDALARLVGVSLAQLEAMERGKAAIPPQVHDKLRVYLYDFLTPGPGSSVHVVFNHKRDNLNPEHRRYLPMSHTWEHRPPAIALGHELIHAWRMMAGMVLFSYGQEEELMTVGLPPFTGMPFTENRLRVEWKGLAIRPDYADLGTDTQLVADLPKRGVDADQRWTGDRGTLTAQDQTLRGAVLGRRAAMGYTDEAEDW